MPDTAQNVAVVSSAPIYAWFEEDTEANDGTGTIKLWSEALEVKLNNNCSYMFSYLRGLKQLNPITDLGITGISTNVTNMSYMFENCDRLTSIDLTNVNFDTRNVTTMNHMFDDCQKLTAIDLTHANFNTSNVKDMCGMFMHCYELTDIDLTHANFNTSNVTNMSCLFYSCRALQSIDLTHANFNTSNVTTMGGMFSDCYKLTAIDLTHDNFVTSQVTNMNSMFNDCRRLTSIDLTTFDTHNLINAEAMFASCDDLSNIIGINDIDTSKLQRIGSMFFDCRSLTSLDLSSWNTSSIVSFAGGLQTNGGTPGLFHDGGTFEYCTNLKELDLSSWDTSRATNMSYMFFRCNQLEKIYASTSFVTTYVSNSTNMFNNCNEITGGNGTVFDENHIDQEYAWIDGRVDPETGYNRPGYFWCHDEYTITFNANAGNSTVTNMPANATKVYGIPLTLPNNIPTRTDYIFKGWATSASANTVQYLPGGTYTINAPATLYALWMPGVAQYLPGQQFNAIIKQLAGNASASSTWRR